MATKPSTVAEYLATVKDDQRAALEKLRGAIRAAAPKAEECISCALLAFRLNGILVGFGASAKHCALYLMSSSTVEAHKDELKDYDLSKGTVRFQPDKPLPAAHLRDLDHPLKKEIEALRRIILGVSPTIREGLKWNAPSFQISDHFATFNYARARDQVQIVFRTGARKKGIALKGAIADPAGPLEWLAAGRCVMRAGGGDVRTRRAAIEDIARQWIAQLPSS